MQERTVTIRISKEQHKDIKVAAAKEGVTIKEYILSLVQKDLDKKK